MEKNGRIKGYAFVEYYDPKLAEVALNRLRNKQIGIRPIKIEYSNISKEGATLNNNPPSRRNDNYSGHRQRPRSPDHHSRRSQSYESIDPIEKHSRSPSERKSYVEENKEYLSQGIRKQYLSNYYAPGEFHEKTPSLSEIQSFLDSTLEQSQSTVISTSRKGGDRMKEYDSRRRERVSDSYGEDRERMNRKDNYHDRIDGP